MAVAMFIDNRLEEWMLRNDRIVSLFIREQLGG